MKNYKVTVRTPGKLLIINGQQIRTPTIFYIKETEINYYKQKFSLQGINKYTFELSDDKPEIKSIRIITNSKQEEQKYEEEEKPKTTLESYLD